MSLVVVLPVVIVVVACVVGVGVGALFVGRRMMRSELDDLRRQADTDRDRAIDVAVESVLAEREATLRAVAAERDTTIQKVVETTVQVADQRLGASVEQGSKELDLRSKSISSQFDTMNSELTKVQLAVTTLQRDRANQHGQVVEQLKAAQQSTQSLAETTQTLRDALANPKARGQWGERMAADVLTASGFLEGVNFRTQTAIANGKIPDFTFLLPKGLHLHMDVKFPYANYVKFLDAESSAEADKARTDLARDVRKHVKSLVARGYVDPETTVDYALMFVPNESVYSFLHENDAELLDNALRQKVILCSPSTLFAVLGVVRVAVESFRLERTSNEILEHLTRFQKQWTKFAEQLDRVEKHFDTARNSFGDLTGKRRRMLERELDRIDQLTIDSGQERLLLEGEGPALRGIESA